jgi:uncharacterized protein (TIGR03435 family)
MRRAIIGLGIFVFASGIVFGQAALESNLAFEVASVKPSGPQSVRGSDGGPGTHDPERFTFSRADLRDLIFNAYLTTRVDDYQQQISGPGWIDTEEYDVAVKIPPRTTKQQFQQMLQNLLAERFKLVVHHDTRVFSVYELVAAKSGPKLKESVDTPDAVAPPDGAPAVDRDGFPVLPAGPGMVNRFGPGPFSHWTARQQSIAALADALSSPNAAGRRVVDKTGLTGKYDFTLYYEMRFAGMPGAAADNKPAPILLDAVEQQLGLRLVEGKAPFDVVVVDHAEKVPTEN